jgi:hypothetical protein
LFLTAPVFIKKKPEGSPCCLQNCPKTVPKLSKTYPKTVQPKIDQPFFFYNCKKRRGLRFILGGQLDEAEALLWGAHSRDGVAFG